jgi:hypothetical protein
VCCTQPLIPHTCNTDSGLDVLNACRSRRGRNAVISGTVAFPVLDGYGDAGLSVMELSSKGVLTVPSLANNVWGSEVTITAYVLRASM